jgi:hypothetical protein
VPEKAIPLYGLPHPPTQGLTAHIADDSTVGFEGLAV